MDKHYVKTIIEGLKSTSSSRVQESLMKIRNKVIVNDNGINLFTECGGLNYLILHLRKPNERILDLTLSILGNCCLNDECRIEVGKLNTFAPLISVLKTVSRESIVGRACRVVGNLAQNSSNAEEFHNHGAVQALVTLIESRDKNTSYPTLIMAVRALRQLWMVIDKREEMLSVNSVRCIANLLHTECDKAGIVIHDVNPQKSVQLRKSVEGLITGILKSFGCFTTHITSQCADQIQGNNRGFHCLVALMTTYESLALRVLINLCYIPTCRTLLGNAGLIQGLIEVLGKITDVTLWPEGAARALSQLCSESNNRCQISRGGGFPILIAAAKEYTYALEALMQFFFDDTGFQILVEEGLVTLLTDILKKHVETMDSEHEYKTPVMNVSLNDALEKASDPTEMNTPKTDVCLFKRRKHLSAENKAGLSVVIERDNYLVGFNETIDTDSDDSKCEDDIQQIGNTLKRPRPKSPTSFMKRARVWSAGGGSGVYWEPKREREGQSTSRSAFSPEPAPMSPLSDGASGFSPEYRAHKKGRSDWSPESGFSTGDGSAASPYWTEYQWSPSSDDSPKSPFSVNEESSDSEISGRYSPVCSEHDAETEPAAGDIIPTTTVELDAAQLALDELAMDDGHEDNDDEPSGETEQDLSDETYTSRVHCVLMLLHRVASGPDPHSMRHRHGYEKDDRILYSTVKLLAEKDCMNTLLDYIAKCRKPKGRPARILSLVFSKSECVTNILHSKIVLRLYSMSQRPKHPVAKCRQCKMVQKVCVNLMTQLSIITESNYANGEITYLLLRGPKSSKEILALTLSYIVKSMVLLNKFYIGCYALKLLFAGVLEPTEEFEYYVTSLGKLATNIHVKNPKVLENRYCDQISVRYDPILDGLSNDEIVTFELDDLSTVKANRTFLCQSSDVFSAMLTGGFKESVEKSVRLKKVTKPGLEYLLTLLNCGLDNANCELQVFPMADELEANLEALLLADRYLLERLKILLISAILQFKLTPDSADKIYVWSLSEGMGFLCVESVAYLLTGEMDDADRTQAFKNIMNLEYKEQWLDDIKSIIMRHLEKMT